MFTVKGGFFVGRIAATLILLSFYSLYIAKILIQKKQAIRTNQMGKGNKPAKVLRIEQLTMGATILQCAASIASILWAVPQENKGLRLTGMLMGIAAIAFFGAAIITMKTSWRVGIPEEKTTLITKGIYRISRNPAFVGFDLLYLSLCLLLPSLPLILSSLLAAGMLHLQILQEESHLTRVFGEAYEAYCKHTRRYL